MAMPGRKVGVTRIGAVGSAMALGAALLTMAGSVAGASPPNRHPFARAPLAAITAQPPPGYRVVLLDYGGNSVIGRGSLVRLRPTAPVVTVQLIRPDAGTRGRWCCDRAPSEPSWASAPAPRSAASSSVAATPR